MAVSGATELIIGAEDNPWQSRCFTWCSAAK
jgi:hypothetical protein